MSCSVKISSKGWAGSQRRIGSLPEDSVYPTQVTSGNLPGSTSTPTLASQSTLKTTQSSKITSKTLVVKKGEDTTKLLKYIDDNIIGKNGTFFGPFGRRKVVYCDYTSSGRSLQFLEEYIAKEVLPCLGDTRTSTSICSLQSSLFRHEARDIVRHAVGAGEQDAVLFTGHGTDDALRTLLRHLDLPQRPAVVFVGPFEHRANLRPWREYGVKIVRIAETKEGFLDLNDLERKLNEERSSGALIVGCFNVASCITGVLADDVATTLLLHQYGALSVWDYTSAAPYIQMDMNPHLIGVGETAVHKDAIIFSGHKFTGGAQSPGVLVVKRSHLKNDIVTEDMRDMHQYLRDPELREENGTAGVIESIRCGLAIQLKESVTPQAIVARQDKICKQVLAHVRTIPELILLGSNSQNIKRLPVFSFMVRHPRGTFLHHNFVCAILNDVFGIQAKGGCACAGRYAHDLMGIDIDLAKKYESLLMEKNSNSSHGESNAEALRPGFARVSLPYFMSEAELAFVLEALKMVATEGWKLLPQYILNPETGEWRHHTNSVFKERRGLGSIRYTDGKMISSERRVSGGAGGIFPQSYADCLHTARNIFNRSRKMAHRFPLQIDRSVFSERGEALRWFILPSEAQDLLLGNSQNVKQDLPFDPTQRRQVGMCSTQTNPIRRLNSDIPKSGNPPLSVVSSPRHHSLPALSIDSQATSKRLHESSSILSTTDDNNESCTNANDKPLELKKPSVETASNSPPIKFAVGGAVSSPLIMAATPAKCRVMATEHSLSNEVNNHRGTRMRCNSLGSAANGTSLPISIPLSPQILSNLGMTSSSATLPRNHRHCSCSNHTELSNSLEYERTFNSPTKSSASSATSSPTSSSSPTPHPYPSSFNHHHNNHGSYLHHHSSSQSDSIHKFGRCSPITSTFSHSSEDNIKAYFKEVTKELATEIKSEIREVISKVDDVLSESNASDNGTPQHQTQRISSINNEKHQKDDSFSASEIAEYLMEFSKEMASEVKSEIRCMVNQVDGLGRFSPDLQSTASFGSTGYGTPEQRWPSSPQAGLKLTKTPKLCDLQQMQQESKMSSECSSDETVIYVVGPKITTKKASIDNTHERAKTSDEEEEHSNKQSVKRVVEKAAGNGSKTLPEIYSAVNSVSSQDSGINLSFNENDVRPADLGRSSSTSSSGSSTELCGNHIFNKKNKMTSGAIRRQAKEEKIPDDTSDDEFQVLREESVDIPLSDDEYDTNNETLRREINNHENCDPRWYSPSKQIWKPTVEALQEFDMIRNKDKILICLPASIVGVKIAAGNYSIALLHALHQYQFYIRSKNIDFEIGVVTIDTTNAHDPLELMAYLKNLEIPYFYEEQEEQASLIDSVITPDAPKTPDFSEQFCNTCGRLGVNMRKRLYSVAKMYGYNVLALSQHLDDLAEGFLSSLFYTGQLKTMKAHHYIKDHDLRIIRPFVYVREKALKQFTEEKKLPVLKAVCLSCEEIISKKSYKNRELMAQQEKTYPRLYWSMRNALRPLILARGNITNMTGHQLQSQHKYKLKFKSNLTHPIPSGLATYQELGDSDSDKGEVF
ncbi:uncharacterized protein [Chelonus insularis]|uniref:uncharacterized protein n=1 Tax=Chelonus insularis TaxID=460826 RepID=UPI00158F217F|nr:uncharacterized protein LOC118064102 [Chelonus insularis]